MNGLGHKTMRIIHARESASRYFHYALRMTTTPENLTFVLSTGDFQTISYFSFERIFFLLYLIILVMGFWGFGVLGFCDFLVF